MRAAPDGLAALRAEAAYFEREHAMLREALAFEWSRLALALAGSNASAATPWAPAALPTQPAARAIAVTPLGAAMPALLSMTK